MLPDAERPSRRWTLAGGLVLAVTAVAAVLLLASPSQAVPARPGVVTLTQPDGETFKARLFGDEWYNGHETRAGHTILQGKRGVWRYARQTDRGELRPSKLIVGHDRPVTRKHLRDRVQVARADRLRTNAHSRVRLGKNVGGPAASPSLGQDKSLIILATFNDQGSLGTSAAQWSNAYFNPTKSVSQYFSANSGGQFSLAPAAESHGTANDGVVGWIPVGVNHPNTSELGVSNRLATRAAIIAADPFVNYAAFDTNGDGVVRNTELHVTVIAAGQEASCCSGYGGAKSIWGHKWQLQGAEIPQLDGRYVGGWGYTQFGEMHGDHMAAMGIMVHEIGHDLDLPDLYDIDNSSEGVGSWSAMGGGSWGYVPGVDPYQGMTPPLMDAWSRSFKGWINPAVVTGTQTTNLNAASSGTNGVAVQMLANPGGPHDWSWQGTGSGEYFLVENRQKTGYDQSLPGAGLVVWHVDESKGNNATDAARLVDIEEADGAMTGRGDPGDTFKAGGATTFSGATFPNSNLNSGVASGVAMSGVSASSATMSATFTAPGGSTAPANDHFANAETVSSRVFDATVNNTAATAEAGELAQTGCSIGRTVWYRYTATRDVRIKADTSGSDFDTVLNVWRGTTLAGLTPQACNDDVGGGPLTSAVPEFVAQAGQTYYFQVGGYYDAGVNGTYVGNLQTHVRIRPLNDDFGQATTIAGTAGTATGNNQNATKQVGEPSITGNGGGGSVWWQWTAPSSGQVTFDTQGSGGAVDSLLGVYTGGAVDGLTLVAENDDIDGANNRRSRVQFAAVAGTTYRIAVDTYNNASPGELSLSWSQTAPAAPGSPTGVNAVAGNASAVVAWTPGPDNGSPITSYTVTSSPGGITKTVAAGTTSTTMTGLTNGQAYTFSLTATNAIGTSPASAPSAAVTPAGAPSAPSGVTATAGNQSATVSWTAPNPNGATITGYTITSSPGGFTKNVAAGTTSTSMTGLTNGTAYTFTVTATNAVGTSPASAPSNAVTPVAVPDAPTGVTAVRGDTSATVSWTPGAANGSPITGYTVTSSPGGITKTVTGTSTNMTGLTNGTAYTFTVTATSAVGTSVPSAPSNQVTPAGAPAAPTAVTATRGDQSATITWVPGADNGAAITRYEIRLTSSNGIRSTWTWGDETQAVFADLTNGETYQVAVWATNAVGISPTRTTTVTPAGVPFAPTGVTAVPGDSSANVSWTPGGGNGSPITGYTVTSSPGGITKSVAGTSTTMTGLANGTAYTFTVRATNAIGESAPSGPSNEVTPEVVVDPSDLAVTMSLVDRPLQTGFAYRVRVERVSGSDVASALVAVTLPSTVSYELPAGCEGEPVVCDLGTVAGGTPRVLDLDVRPLSPGPHEASATLTTADADAGNNSAAAEAGVGFVCDNAPTAGKDRVTGTAGNDVLCGLEGDDTIAGGGGDDLLFGGAGTDTLSYASATAAMVINLNFQDLTAETAWEAVAGAGDGADLATEFERAQGSRFNDTLVGHTTVGDSLWGLGGKDLIYGYRGNDKLYGGGGKDKLWGHQGKDLLVGGAGRDVLDGGPKRDTCQEKADKRISCEA